MKISKIINLKAILSVIIVISIALTLVPAFNINSSALTTSNDIVYTVLWNETVRIIDYVGTAKNLEIPAVIDGFKVVDIYDSAFEDCDTLESVTVADGIKEIGIMAFAYCSNLVEISIPDSVTSIDNGAFLCCEKLTTFTFPKNITKITKMVLSDCYSLENVIMYEGIKLIDEGAFAYCSNLTEITIPSSVTEIGLLAFVWSGITDVYYAGTETQWSNIKIATNNSGFDDVILSVPIHYNYNIDTDNDTNVDTEVKAESSGVKGDINNDNVLDIIDVVIARAYIVGTRYLTTTQIASGDMNKDSDIDIIDVVMMRKTIIGESGPQQPQTPTQTVSESEAKEIIRNWYSNEKLIIDYFLDDLLRNKKLDQWSIPSLCDGKVISPNSNADYESYLTKDELNKISEYQIKYHWEWYSLASITILQEKIDNIFGPGHFKVSELLDESSFITQSGYVAFGEYGKGSFFPPIFMSLDYVNNTEVHNNYTTVNVKSLYTLYEYLEPDVPVCDNYNFIDEWTRQQLAVVSEEQWEDACDCGYTDDGFNKLAYYGNIDTDSLTEKTFVLYKVDGKTYIWDFGYPDEVTYPQ